MIGIGYLVVKIKSLPYLWKIISFAALFLWLFLPSIIALLKKHKSAKTIVAINCVFFWEFWIWFPLMVWCLTDKEDKATIQKMERTKQRIKILTKKLLGKGS